MSIPLLFFVHGFRGTIDSFCQFPDELRKDLNDVNIFKYEYVSQGEYAVQVTALADALKREGGGRPVIIIGHSMGGLLAVDAAIALGSEGSDVDVKGVLAFDSPFFGIREELIVDRIEFVLSIPSLILSPIGTIFAIVGAMLSYFSNKQVKQIVDRWILTQKEYAKFLAALWDNEGMKKRFDALGQLKRKLVFKCFYALRSTAPSATSNLKRSFITHPPPEIKSLYDFKPILYTERIHGDEVDIHMDMFQSRLHKKAYRNMFTETMIFVTGVLRAKP
ncbi:hypothetical protein BDK51DRAFT_48385 [Blyttiomyces helicus]|uniref:AB hydrolase-1 domain-containing protein n=1 Tax=Blyttiomyces helicus TaxID=388810 RepID=A0A4P9W031_9FUNG|nr:hypothetical protein BDK51DRAFT_48385 [Blyttiomyces helicus]|eukprot:RKO84433.1 hypothetical protein BDK51DRAFT_48385 [Blyttiomyces helicus]